MKKGILIDVTNKTISEVTLGKDYREIYQHLGCDLFDVVSIDEKNDVYVDDEGLLNLNENSMFFKIDTYPQPLSGNGLILGIDIESGESVDTTLTVDDVKKRIQFLTIHEASNLVLSLD